MTSSTYKTLNQVRSTFLDYFAKQGHLVAPSASLVPNNDPTLMFTNSGMVPFKNYFTGKDKPPSKRVTSAQKSVRAGGKHNDLDNVGYTARHHTFFEMMGNFSFGDYFKEDAIRFAWEVVTKEFGLPKEKLLATVYHTDDEAAELWKKIAGLSDDRVIRIPTKDNFWMMGDTGPCGPCSEIFYDHGDHIWGGPPGSAEEDGDRFMEIWNLVFMQYEQIDKDTRIDLPNRCIDTGMGLERVTNVLQGKHDNFDIDLFQHIIGAIQDLTHTKAEGEARFSQRIIADHLRTASFLVAEGVMPGNEGRNYVLRRIMRRAMRHAHLLGSKTPLMHQLVPTLVNEMGQAYPELVQQQTLIQDTLYREENRFRETLDRGLKLLDEAVSKLPEGGTLPGDVAFKLYDTYGFPLDLTSDVLRDKKLQLDEAGFNDAMAQQKALARQSWTGSGQQATEKVWYDIQDTISPTEFQGYTTLNSEGVIQALVKDGTPAEKVSVGDTVAIVLNQTPFYAEAGGQIGDTGILRTENGAEIAINDTRKPIGTYTVHYGTVTKGDIKLNDAVEARVDCHWRRQIQAHHAATHLLHEALRRELGDHVAQKGSYVAPDRLRLDFSHPDGLSDEQMQRITENVRAQILNNTPVTTRVMGIEEAKASGARALFGEKYGDEVRVVSMGDADENGRTYSIELCGGTHVKSTGEIGAFRLIGENSVSSGVRRIQAVVGITAEKMAEAERDTLEKAAGLFKVQPELLYERVQKLLDDNQSLSTEIGNLRRKVAMGGGANDTQAIETIGNVKFIAKTFDDLPAKELRPVADQLKQQIGSGVVAVSVIENDRVSLVVAVTNDLTGTISAVDLVNAGAEVLGGKGGGRPELAQAGGANTDQIQAAMDKIRAKLAA